ncbi:hypothetical protein QJQ45_009612, partial [Haematococcus lacustris]
MFAAGFSPAPLCHPQASSSSGPQRRLALAHAAPTPPAGGKEPSSDKASLPSGRPKAGSAAASAPKPASSSRAKDWLSSWAADSPGPSQSRPKPGLGSSAAQEGGVESGIARTRARIGAWDSQVKLAARPPSSQQALGTGARASAALPSSSRPAAAVAVQPVGPGMVQAADGSWRLEGCRQEQGVMNMMVACFVNTQLAPRNPNVVQAVLSVRPGSVSGLMVLHELGQLPLQLYWLRAACKFWNTAKLSHSDLLMRVIKADVELGRGCQASWSAQFQLAARELMGGEFTLSPDMVLGTKAMEVKWLE